MSKHLLVIDPDYSDSITPHLTTTIPFNLAIYYLLPHKKELPCKGHHYLDILQKINPSLSNLSKIAWEITRRFPDQLPPSCKKQITIDGINILKCHELFFGSHLSWGLRDLLVLNKIYNDYPIQQLSLISSNNFYTQFIRHFCHINKIPLYLLTPNKKPNHSKNKPLTNTLNLKLLKKTLNSCWTTCTFLLKRQHKPTTLAQSHRNTDPLIQQLKQKEPVLCFNSNFAVLQTLFKLKQKYQTKTNPQNYQTTLKTTLTEQLKKEIHATITIKLSGKSFILEHIITQLIKELPTLQSTLKFHQFIIKKTNPSTILLSSYVSFEQRVMIELAKQKNIPSIATQHGLMNPFRYSSDIIYTDILGVWGQHDQESYINCSPKNKEKIKILGNPLYSPITSLNSTYNQTIMINLPHLYTTIAYKDYRRQPIHWTLISSNYFANTLIEQYISLINKLSKTHKLHGQVHPMDIPSQWKALLKNTPISLSQGDSTKQLKQSKLLISTGSTLLLDALQHNLTTIEFNPWQSDIYQNFAINFQNTKTTLTAHSIEDVLTHVNTVYTQAKTTLTNNNKRKHILEKIISCSGTTSLKKWEQLFNNITT